MSAQSPLILPLNVEALVVNDPFREGGNRFLRSQMLYAAIPNCGNGQPNLNDNDPYFTSASVVPPNNVAASDFYDGVYLKWRLPDALTEGVQESADGSVRYPLVPNRWLVVRYGGALATRDATAWIIESDYVWTTPPSPMTIAQSPSRYVGKTATGNTPVSINIGRNVPLGGWTEHGTSLRLTAIAPGNPAFASYQPQNNNVFSFVDVLGGHATRQTLSYLVCGWYARPGDDPLAGVTSESFAGRLEELRWSLDAGTDPSLFASWCLCSGSVDGVEWQTSTIPPGGAPGTSPVTLTVANSGIEALTTLIAAQAASHQVHVDAELLEAFQLDMLGVLDEADGASRLAEKLFETFFQRYGGGYVWEIGYAPTADTEVAAAELEVERRWLRALNEAQLALDEAVRELVSRQAQLYIMWWKYTYYPEAFQGSTTIPGLEDRSQLTRALDPAATGSLAQLTAAQFARVAALAAAVPQGEEQLDLAVAILAYADARALPRTRQLKRTTRPSFYQPNNPVVLIAGAGATGIVRRSPTTHCRFPSQLVTGFHLQVNDQQVTVSASTPGLRIPHPDLSQVSGVPWSVSLVASLVDEFFLLDPANATMVAAKVPGATIPQVAQAMEDPGNDVGVYPTGAVGRWKGNPWHPLLLVWQAAYYPIAYGTPAKPNWTFDHGAYSWSGAPASVGPVTTLLGTLQLTTAATSNMRARIEAFLESDPSLPAQEAAALRDLLAFVESEDSWDLLTQSLSGFNEQLRTASAGVFLSPASSALETTPPLPTLIGEAAGYPPALPLIPEHGVQPSTFLPWRCGQFAFLDLVVVDEWGQALWPIDSSTGTSESPYLPPAMTPVLTTEPVPFVVSAGPVVELLAPSAAAQGAAAFVLTITGSGFAAHDAVAYWGAVRLNTTVTGPTLLAAQVTPDLLATPGSVPVTVVSRGSTSPAADFTVSSGPFITSLSPDLLQAGMSPSVDVPIRIRGVGFTAAAVARWNGVALATDIVDSTSLIAHVPARAFAAPEVASIAVVVGATSSNVVTFPVTPGAAISSLSPASATQDGGALSLTVHGVGFRNGARVTWGGAPLSSIVVSATEMRAEVPATLLGAPGTFQVTETFGHAVRQADTDALVQLPPGLLQPARLAFDFAAAGSDERIVGGAAVAGADENPIAGWVLPNHLDESIAAYDGSGVALGDLALGRTAGGVPTVAWTAAPNAPFSTLEAIAEHIPHFGPFLLALRAQGPTTFAAFMAAIDETLWSTTPAGADFDASLAVLMGRPLAMVRATLRCELEGTPYIDPSWQYTFAPATPAVTGYQFAIEVGDLAQVDDGLIGYFVGDNYSQFNVVQQAPVTPSAYLRPIGVDGNYLSLPFDGHATQSVSMLVDPRAPVHATTGILPPVSLALAPEFIDDALGRMIVTFRVNGALTDRQVAVGADGATDSTTILIPVPQETTGTWTWLEQDALGWSTFPTAPADTMARLSGLPPILRRGLLQLTSALRPGQLAEWRRQARDIARGTSTPFDE